MRGRWFSAAVGVWAGTVSAGVTNATTTILNTHSFWRCWMSLRPPVYGTASTARPDAQYIPIQKVGKENLRLWPSDQPTSPFPPGDWTQPDYEDGEWWRQPGPFPPVSFHEVSWGQWDDGDDEPRTIALWAVRGKFAVTDPARVRRLTISATFRGGMVVYLNGREVLRSHISGGGSGAERLADDYPPEAFGESKKGGKSADVEKRRRKVKEVEIPLNALRKGLNVLGIEIHRAALLPGRPRWNTCALEKVELRAEGDGIEPNVVRPRGVQVWTENLLTEVTDVDYGDPNEPLYPMRIVGTRGGKFLGQVVISGDREIRGVKARCVSDLKIKGGSAIISRGCVRFFYLAMDQESLYVNPRYPNAPGHKALRVTLQELKVGGKCLLAPPTVVPIRVKKRIYPGYRYVWGAVQPIWLEVSVPRDAVPGVYHGECVVEAEGVTERRVPVEVHVYGWTLPEPRQWETVVDWIQSPDHLSRYYKVPLWSEAHWKLMEKSFHLLGAIGARTVYIPAIIPTHFGNTQTMIRWVPGGGEGTHTFDFGILQRYLDLAEKHMGKPRVVCLYVWDVYLGGTVHRVTGGMGPHATKYREKMVGVSRVERGTGKVDTMEVPAYGEEAEPYWMPFGKAVMQFMERRGWRDVLLLGMAADIRPTREQVEFWAKVFPGVGWVAQGHDRADTLYGVPVEYSSSVFGCLFAGVDPAIKRLYGWQRPNVTTVFPRRIGEWMVASQLFHWLSPEWNLTGWQNGIGRIPADFFPQPSYDPKAYWGNASLQMPWLAAGPDGAQESVKYLFFRGGVQECEARIFLEKVLTDPRRAGRLPGRLRETCREILDERTRYAMWVFEEAYYNYNVGTRLTSLLERAVGVSWFGGSGWLGRAARLYKAAAEVEQVLGATR